MKAVEYTAPILPDGRLEIPREVNQGLHLRPGMRVKVILLYGEESPADQESLAAKRAAVWAGIDELRARLSRMNFNLTDSLLQARQQEDASL